MSGDRLSIVDAGKVIFVAKYIEIALRHVEVSGRLIALERLLECPAKVSIPPGVADEDIVRRSRSLGDVLLLSRDLHVRARPCRRGYTRLYTRTTCATDVLDQQIRIGCRPIVSPRTRGRRPESTKSAATLAAGRILRCEPRPRRTVVELRRRWPQE